MVYLFCISCFNLWKEFIFTDFFVCSARIMCILWTLFVRFKLLMNFLKYNFYLLIFILNDLCSEPYTLRAESYFILFCLPKFSQTTKTFETWCFCACQPLLFTNWNLFNIYYILTYNSFGCSFIFHRKGLHQVLSHNDVGLKWNIVWS